jgi:chromosome segregation ATPase
LLLPLLAAASISSQVVKASAANVESSPIDKVVTLIKEMKAQTEKEAKEDMEAYDKYKCWCDTTEGEKTAAINAAEKHIASLNAFIEEAAGKEGELKTEIVALGEDIAEDQSALETASNLRASENKDFSTEESDIKETLDLLSQAITVLSKVQLVQKGSKAEAQALLQVRALVHGFKVVPKFHNVMMKDLFDLLGALPGDKQPRSAHAGAFLGQSHAAPTGAAAGAKSYNSRSGGIVGILKQMSDENKKDLGTAQKQELQAEIDFQKLRAAKEGEIKAGSEQKDQKETELSDLLYKVAKSKKDVEKTQGALSADEAFMLDMTKNCRVEDESYANRVKARTVEITALGETLDILTGDEARSLFDKTISLLQVKTVSNANAAQQAAAQEKASTRAMQRIVLVAKKHKNWQLASLALKVKLDAFVKVKAAMDKMLGELKAQQKAEYEKNEACKTAFDQTEDKIKVGEQEKADLDNTHQDLTNTLERLADQIKELQAEVAENEVSLKEAGEQRKADNQLYQTTMSDQRATIRVLSMAADRLKKVYGFVEVQKHSAGPPPPKPAAFKKQNGGVMQLLASIISDAESVEIEIKMGEQKSQEEYASFVAATTASIEADRQAISEASEQAASAEGSKSETQEAQLANDGELAKLDELLAATHTDCDFVLKYFDIRQSSRSEEMAAIEEAKSILSGADFS